MVEWRYPANLAVYSAMDRIGIENRDNFADWQRSALTLELKDKKFHRRFAMAHNRTFFHVADPQTPAVEVDKALALFDRLAHQIELQTITRVGVRQWATFKWDDSFKDLVKLCVKRFQPQSESLKQTLRGTLDDMSYHSEVTHSDGWRYNLRVGPMTRAQWTEAVSHEEAAFGDKDEYNAYKEQIPENFLYADIDGFKEDVPYNDSKLLLKSMGNSAREILSGIHAHLKEGK